MMNKEMIEAIKTRVTLGKNYKCVDELALDMCSTYGYGELMVTITSLFCSGSIYRDNNGILKVNGINNE